MFEQLQAMGFRVIQVGSRTIPGASTAQSDWDYLVEYDCDYKDKLEPYIRSIGFVRDGTDGDEYEGQVLPFFTSWKWNRHNLIVTCHPTFGLRFRQANEKAIAQGLVNKADRISLFQCELYENCA